MPDTELLPDGADDEPIYPRRAAPVRVVLGLGALVAVLVVGVLIGRSHAPAPRSAPAPRVTVTASPTATLDAPSVEAARPDVLDFTGVFSTSGSLGSRTLGYAFGLVNVTAHDVRVRYPIELVGQDGTRIGTAFAGLYSRPIGLDQINGFTLPAHRIETVQAGGDVTLLLSVRIDCDDPAVTATVPPHVRVRLAGSHTSADFDLPHLASGFQDAVSQICG